MLAIYFVLIVLGALEILAEREMIKWIPSGDFAQDMVIPAGYERSNSSEEYTNFYVARVKNSTNLIPGKYSPQQRKCYVGISGREIEKSERDCQLLIFPKGTTSWIYTGFHDPLPEDMLQGGKIQSNHVYLCRARKEGQVLLGWLNTKGSKKNCYTTSNGVEYKHKEYEILTQNFMTKVTGTLVQD